jgi:hypothetical protein
MVGMNIRQFRDCPVAGNAGQFLSLLKPLGSSESAVNYDQRLMIAAIVPPARGNSQ